MPHMDVSVVVVGDSYSSAEKNRYKTHERSGRTRRPVKLDPLNNRVVRSRESASLARRVEIFEKLSENQPVPIQRFFLYSFTKLLTNNGCVP